MKTTKTKNLLLGIAIGIGTSFATVAQNVPNYVPTNGLVGWWPFNGNANDESGNNNNGTVNGATLTSDRFGNANKAYSFDGVNDFIDCGLVPNLGNYPQFLTQSAWILATSDQSNYCKMPVISKRNTGSNSWATLGAGGNGTIGVPWNNQAYFFVNAPNYGNGITNALFSNNVTNNNSWHMITGVKNGNKYKLYFDNVLQDSIIDNYSPLGSTDNMLFGHESIWGFTCEQWYNGKLDDIGIWNRALTQQEITDLYNANICYQTITVTDTLIINTNTVSFNPITYQNTIKIFPNPTSDHITINYGNFATLNGYQLKIINSLGQQMFQTAINQQSSYINLSNWTGNGIYFVQIIDPQGNIIDIRKIVLQ